MTFEGFDRHWPVGGRGQGLFQLKDSGPPLAETETAADAFLRERGLGLGSEVL